MQMIAAAMFFLRVGECATGQNALPRFLASRSLGEHSGALVIRKIERKRSGFGIVVVTKNFG
jgi:hypothetical protein